MRFIAGVFCLFMVVPGSAAPDDAAKDKDKLKGSWSVVSVERNGDRLPDEVTREWKITFQADKLIAKVSDGIGYATANIERDQITRVRGLIPVASHRRL